MFHPKSRNQKCIPVVINAETGTCEKNGPGDHVPDLAGEFCISEYGTGLFLHAGSLFL